MDLSLLIYGLAWILAGRLFSGDPWGSTRRAVTVTGAFALLIAIPENAVTFIHFTGVFAYCGLGVLAAALAGRTWAAVGMRGWAAWSWLVAGLSLILYIPAGLSGSSGYPVLTMALGTWQRLALVPLVAWVSSLGVACAAGYPLLAGADAKSAVTQASP